MSRHLNDVEVMQILELHAKGMGAIKIAKELRLSKTTVSRRIRNPRLGKSPPMSDKEQKINSVLQQWDEVVENVLLTHAPERYGRKIYGGLLDEWDILHERYGRR